MDSIDGYNKRVIEIEIDIEHWVEEVNNHGVWLFLGTVGCLGIGDSILRHLSFVILALVYVVIISKFITRIRDINAKSADLNKEIPCGLECRAALNRVRTKCLGIDNLMNACWIAIICLLFYVLSAVFSLNLIGTNKSADPTALNPASSTTLLSHL